MAGDSSQVSVEKARETIFYNRIALAIPVSNRILLDPAVETRFWQGGSDNDGQLFGLHLSARYLLSPSLTIVPALRLDRGELHFRDVNFVDLNATVTGWGLSVMLRYSK